MDIQILLQSGVVGINMHVLGVVGINMHVLDVLGINMHVLVYHASRSTLKFHFHFVSVLQRGF